MRVVLLRVGIDKGRGGIYGPLFSDGRFEFVPIPDRSGRDKRTYSTLVGKSGVPLIEYFPESRQSEMTSQSVHVDPEFESFTYGDPTRPKRGLRKLGPGDLLVFYAGLTGWNCEREGALYIVGYFEVALAGIAAEFTEEQLSACSANYHVRHSTVFEDQRDRLVLVKGGPESRLLQRAHRISERGQDSAGRPLFVLSSEMVSVLGPLSGKGSIQRSNPRWLDPEFTEKAARFVRSLR